MIRFFTEILIEIYNLCHIKTSNKTTKRTINNLNFYDKSRHQTVRKLALMDFLTSMPQKAKTPDSLLYRCNMKS